MYNNWAQIHLSLGGEEGYRYPDLIRSVAIVEEGSNRLDIRFGILEVSTKGRCLRDEGFLCYPLFGISKKRRPSSCTYVIVLSDKDQNMQLLPGVSFIIKVQISLYTQNM